MQILSRDKIELWIAEVEIDDYDLFQLLVDEAGNTTYSFEELRTMTEDIGPTLSRLIAEFDQVTFVPSERLATECVVADQFCKVEPTLQCHSCGQWVCDNCMLEIKYYGTEREICHNCVEDYYRDDKLVIQHLEELAGV